MCVCDVYGTIANILDNNQLPNLEMKPSLRRQPGSILVYQTYALSNQCGHEKGMINVGLDLKEGFISFFGVDCY